MFLQPEGQKCRSEAADRTHRTCRSEKGLRNLTAAPADRVRRVVQSAFNGKRIVSFSGGAAKDDSEMFDEVRAISDGGGFGSIIRRNSFQWPKPKALEFLAQIIKIYAE
jgi:DhnA family fructose-bisphosphate aldolase class Ia